MMQHQKKFKWITDNIFILQFHYIILTNLESSVLMDIHYIVTLLYCSSRSESKVNNLQMLTLNTNYYVCIVILMN